MENWGHRIGKFNILSVNVILFQGNQKNIMVGVSDGNNAASVCLQKNRAISGLSGRLKAQFLVTHGCFRCFPEEPIVFVIYVEFGAF